ncbi:MAG TPA: hypothetical protein VHG93_23570 [Longimicrobium sp.]|nr:hypothetical protein [Longimicrobium sp.]
MRTIITALFIAAVPPLHGCTHERPADPNVVSPRFAWTPGTRAWVTTEREEFQRRPLSPDTTRERSRSSLRVQRHRDGLRIVHHDSAAGEHADMPQLPPRGATVLGGLVVSRRGTFVRLEGAAEASAELRRVVRDSLRRVPDEAVRLMEELVSEEALLDGARQYWALLVGRWAGREIAIGEIHEERGLIASPVGMGAKVRTTTEWAAEGRVPCTAGEREARCVRFRVRSATDPADLARNYRQMRSALGSTPEVDATDYIVVHAGTTYLITEEATLRPHRIEDEAFLSIRVGDAEVTVVERQTTRFTYAP